MRYRVALVGHCGFDAGSLSRAVERALEDVEVISINSRQQLDERLTDLHLLLINRQLDGRFGIGEGVELMRALRADGKGSVALMLVSNYEEAQASAEAAGAAPGFGKRDLGSDLVTIRIRTAMGLGAMS